EATARVARDHAAPVAQDRRRRDLRLVDLRGSQADACLDVPQIHLAVPSARDRPPAIGEEREAEEPLLRVDQGLHMPRGVEAPDPERPIIEAPPDYAVALAGVGPRGDPEQLGVTMLRVEAMA